MSTNELEQNCINNGIAMPALRRALRLTSDDMIAAGPGTTVGVHDFGVFYVHRNVERFVVRGADVFKIPERDVLKLRPQKSDPTKLTESADARLNQDFDFGSGAVAWQFKSTSRSGRFLVVVPVAYVNNVYHFVRDDEQGRQTYVLAKDTYSDANLQSMQGIDHNVTTKEVLAIRYATDLRSITEQAIGGAVVDYGNQEASAAVTGVGLKNITDPTYGAEALAWFRQRAIDISER